jgi:hypothetical protein
MSPDVISAVRSAALTAEWVSERVPIAQLAILSGLMLALTLPEKHFW